MEGNSDFFHNTIDEGNRREHAVFQVLQLKFPQYKWINEVENNRITQYDFQCVDQHNITRHIEFRYRKENAIRYLESGVSINMSKVNVAEQNQDPAQLFMFLVMIQSHGMYMCPVNTFHYAGNPYIMNRDPKFEVTGKPREVRDLRGFRQVMDWQSYGAFYRTVFNKPLGLDEDYFLNS